MPYITKNDREKYSKLCQEIDKLSSIETKGDLEFLVFKLMIKFMSSREERYSTLHDCTYSVAHVSDEFRRRFLDKRENDAREINGDII
jgi:hypothetical protein